MSLSSLAVITKMFEAHDIRFYIREDGEILTCAMDVCDALELTNSRKATANLDEDERDDVTTSDAIGRGQKMTFVTESGLYALIFQSRKPEAKRFRKWVTADVIPSIRQGKLPKGIKPNAKDELTFNQRLNHTRRITRLVAEFQ